MVFHQYELKPYQLDLLKSRDYDGFFLSFHTERTYLHLIIELPTEMEFGWSPHMKDDCIDILMEYEAVRRGLEYLRIGKPSGMKFKLGKMEFIVNGAKEKVSIFDFIP